MEIRVERVDSNLLALECERYWASDPGGPMLIASDEIFFFDKIGNDLGRVGYGLCYPNPNFKWWKIWKRQMRWLIKAPDLKTPAELREIDFYEPVDKAIERLKIRERVFYILRIVPFDFDEYSNYAFSITLYKPPKTSSLAEWLENEPQREEKIIKREVERTDQV